VAVLALTCISGCRDGVPRSTHEVTPAGGVVTYQGQPAAGASVAFEPIGEATPGAYGHTDARGRFRLQTFGRDDGAIPGEYAVTIRKIEASPLPPDYDPDNPPPVEPAKDLLPEMYGNPATSGLSATVTAQGPNVFTFALD
jgi:hypothetical protein